MPSSSSLQPVCLNVPGDPEGARVLRICDPGPAIDGALTFEPATGHDAENWLAAWRAWRTGVFAQKLAPALAAAAVHATGGRAREMRDLDIALTSQLDPLAGRRSVEAGRRLLRRLSPSRGERWVSRYLDWESKGAAPAHFAIIYAGQNAFFHLPLRLLLPTYAYWEWSAALSARPPHGPPPDFGLESTELQRVVDQTLAPTLFHAAAANESLGVERG